MLNDNDFTLFGLPVAFDIDATSLTARYRDLQRAVHPDRFSQATEAERTLAVMRAARINDAYQNLKTPLARAQTMLKLFGHGIAEEKATLKDPEFLMEHMEMHEAVQEADLKALDGLRAHIDARAKSLENALASGFASPSPDWKALQTTVLKLQFIQKLAIDAEARVERLLGM